MIKMFLKKFWIVLISCLVATGIAIACADDWAEEYGVSNFSPEIVTDTTYSPFFFSYQYYYGINYETDQHTRFNSNNVSDWAGFLKNSVPASELQELLQNASAGGIDSLAAFIAGKTIAVPGALRSFAIVKQKNNSQVSAFINYLQLAKRSEVYSLNAIPDYWDTDSTKKPKTYNVKQLNTDLLNAFTKTSDVFLKERYWFQLVRLYFFNSKPQQSIDIFNSGEKNMPQNTIYYRTMAYAAGAFYKLKDFSKANYYYSLVYNGCTELKTAAHYSFHPQEQKDWNATLALCRNNDEKATLWQMLGVFYADEERSINEIYQLNPASNKLELLLVRAVNKYEQKFNGTGSLYQITDTTAHKNLPAIVNKVATAGNTNKPWLWQLAAGYINTLDKKYTTATGWYAKAEKNLPADKATQAQLRLLKFINNVGQVKKIDTKFENGILADLRWLKENDFNTLPNLRHADAFEWIKQTMSARYKAQNDWVKAECFASSNIFYTSDKRVEALKVFLKNTNKTAYENLCADLCVKKPDDLFEYQAIVLTYKDSIEAAIEKMEKTGKGAENILPGNPFNARINDCHDCDHEAAQKIKYSKLSLLKKLKELKDNINGKNDIYNNALLMANAFYNLSHFGNARYFYEGKVIGEGISDPGYIDSVYRKMLVNMNVTSHYYTLALQNAANDEQKAKCQYLLSKCERNQWYNETIYYKNKSSYDRETGVDFIGWNGFKALKQYANTKYYQEAIKECGYFKTYVNH